MYEMLYFSRPCLENGTFQFSTFKTPFLDHNPHGQSYFLLFSLDHSVLFLCITSHNFWLFLYVYWFNIFFLTNLQSLWVSMSCISSTLHYLSHNRYLIMGIVWMNCVHNSCWKKILSTAWSSTWATKSDFCWLLALRQNLNLPAKSWNLFLLRYI